MGTFLDLIIYLFGREGGDAREEGQGSATSVIFFLGFPLLTILLRSDIPVYSSWVPWSGGTLEDSCEDLAFHGGW